ncbi:hypothetical protein [Streptococcus dentiloxodontae]
MLTHANGSNIAGIILIPLGIIALIFCGLGLGFLLSGKKSKQRHLQLQQEGQSIEGTVTGYKKTHQTVQNSVGLKYYHRLIIEGGDGNTYYSPLEQLLILERLYPIGSKINVRTLPDNPAIYEVEAEFYS